MITPLLTLPRTDWTTTASNDVNAAAQAALESGSLLFFPALSFRVDPNASRLFSSSIASAKNVSFDPVSGRLGGAAIAGDDAELMRNLFQQFSDQACDLLTVLLPGYGARLERARASFRPVEIAGRHTSWRQDDTRLHIDSFPATPAHGKRILRVFTNVNPYGKARVWRVGEDFEAVAARFADRLRRPLPGSAAIRRLLHLTKTRRTVYDAFMLQLHDLMKADDGFQRGSPQAQLEFPCGSTWVAFTDAVSHAALAGQYQFEHTFLVPVAAMDRPERSPLRILERLTSSSLL